MKIKNLIFFDWDDTLSDFATGIIPDSAIKALQTLNQQEDTLVAVASGRAAFFFQNKVKDFRLDAMVCTNGQYASLKGQVVYESFANTQDRDRLIEVLKPYGGSVMGIHSEQGIKMYLYPTHPEILNHDSYRSLSAYGPSIETIDQVHILLAGYPESADEVVQKALPNYQCHRYNGYMVDIIPKNASKLVGIEVIAQQLGLDLKDVYAFGDSHNDFQMIEGVGIGIALGNAKEEIKAIAQYVTRDLRDDGVYKALVHFGLLKEKEMKLVVNADDFGLTYGVNAGIIDALKRGILRSTTAMCNMPAIENAAMLAKANPDLGVGIHLVLTAGRPLVAGHKTLVDENGNFLKNAVLMKKSVDIEEVYTEYVAQMERFIQLFGCKPTHIDGHHHTQALPQTVEATKRLAKTYGIEYIRAVTPGVDFVYDFYADQVSVSDLIQKLEARKDKEKVELMCHVAFIDVDLMQCSTYNVNRVKELETLISPEVHAWVKDHNVELTHF